MRTVKPLLKSIFIPGMLFLGACCCEKDVVVAPPPPPPPPVVVEPGLGDVFYDYDKSELRMDAVEQLKTNAAWMQRNAASSVVIEGHCDERGTNEYNLALGERRANSAKDYIVNLGVDGARMKTVSYGEERPFALGHDEASWAQNRRAHFVGQ
ncbi:peptidoglycan-associated lipoprotein Pal [Chlorobium phaeobacteroides]|jgi:peptidoglycan-associated lipoprotein|uniref:Peptidoglycan-associated lipoprotein n=1 Tax=Chlorobium phaeobacteroides (strain DSM 266 / SMG 266 / 2430) TaxID=290317 RepID=A1BET4_CHLPD|nr:peptidoglycan-associated lipoprotein Pal [Chlorobium phaeobacteroides]ABL64911.1 OmpA/MotB domain protein [Chlorobium phaeobacteroides DSM 266]MBV5328627.1 peptidoglycan-associated lipoprotein Pal [Chlorobium sp.]